MRYLNGIDNSTDQAWTSAHLLSATYGNRTPLNDAPIEYRLLYNKSHGAPLDVIEVAQQKLNEKIRLGILTAGKVQQLVDTLTSTAIDVSTKPAEALGWAIGALGIPRVSDAAEQIAIDLDALSDTFDLFSDREREVVQDAVEDFNDVATLPSETRDVVEEHVAAVQQDVELGANVLVVAHSQGNLFATTEYRELEGLGVLSSQLRVEHVAPAALHLVGPYVTADTDLVINALLPLIGSAAPPNVHMPALEAGSNHGFNDAYMRSGYEPRDKIDADFAQHLAILSGTLTPGSARSVGEPGWFDGPVDVVLSPTERFLYVADRGARVQRVDRVTRTIEPIVDGGLLSDIRHLAVDPQGNVYASGRRPDGGGRIEVLDRSNNWAASVVTDMTTASAPITFVDDTLMSGASFPDNYGPYEHLVAVPLEGGPLVDLLRPSYFRDYAISSAIGELAVDGSGDLLVTIGGSFSSGYIFYQAAVWRYTGSLTAPSPSGQFTSSAFEQVSGHAEMQRIAAGDQRTFLAGEHSVRELTHGWSIEHAFYPEGEWAGNWFDDPGGRIADEAGMRLILGDPENRPGPANGELSSVGGIAVNEQRVLYAADTGNDRVVRVGTLECPQV